MKKIIALSLCMLFMTGTLYSEQFSNRGKALKVLELKKGATDPQIKNAYRKLALKWHPDKNKGNQLVATENFKNISAAYSYLTEDPEETEDPQENTDRKPFDIDSRRQAFKALGISNKLATSKEIREKYQSLKGQGKAGPKEQAALDYLESGKKNMYDITYASYDFPDTNEARKRYGLSKLPDLPDFEKAEDPFGLFTRYEKAIKVVTERTEKQTKDKNQDSRIQAQKHLLRLNLTKINSLRFHTDKYADKNIMRDNPLKKAFANFLLRELDYMFKIKQAESTKDSKEDNSFKESQKRINVEAKKEMKKKNYQSVIDALNDAILNDKIPKSVKGKNIFETQKK